MSLDKQVKENLTLTAPTIYEIIAEEGREELERPFNSLLFSGIAAGLCISFSLFTMGYLALMTDNPLIISVGYCIGFLMVILGRLQLFTENTITAILPVLNKFSTYTVMATAKLWGLVFVANMIGTAFAAFLIGPVGIAPIEQLEMFLAISHHAVDKTPMEIFLTAIPAGFILATTVWMLPSSRSKVLVIMLMTYVISIGGFSHVVAGSTEVFLMLFNNELGIIDGLTFIVLAGLGNIVGGTFLFSMLAYGQTYMEL